MTRKAKLFRQENEGRGFVLVGDVGGANIEWARPRDARRGRRTIYSTERAACDAARTLRHQGVMQKWVGWDVLPVLAKGRVVAASARMIELVAQHKRQAAVAAVTAGALVAAFDVIGAAAEQATKNLVEAFGKVATKASTDAAKHLDLKPKKVRAARGAVKATGARAKAPGRTK